MRWSYGVTTVPSRRRSLLAITLQSLGMAGFDRPHLFVDGGQLHKDIVHYQDFNLAITTRRPAVKTYGNWVLALWELYLREPAADRYAIFQDDLITYPNLRGYLDQCVYPEQGYWNLYTYPIKQAEPPSEDFVGFHESNQMGRGAVALVFDRPAVTTLLQQKLLVEHPQNSHRGTRSVDGTVIDSFKNIRPEPWKEYIHAPTLVQHIGHELSTMKKKGYRERPETFRGESFNALDLLPVEVEQ